MTSRGFSMHITESENRALQGETSKIEKASILHVPMQWCNARNWHPHPKRNNQRCGAADESHLYWFRQPLAKAIKRQGLHLRLVRKIEWKDLATIANIGHFMGFRKASISMFRCLYKLFRLWKTGPKLPFDVSWSAIVSEPLDAAVPVFFGDHGCGVLVAKQQTSDPTTPSNKTLAARMQAGSHRCECLFTRRHRRGRLLGQCKGDCT